MKKTSMSGSLRANVGKKDAKQNRNNGLIPCVVYGGKDELHITLAEKELSKIIYTAYSHLINLDIEGKAKQCIIQEVQYHPVTDHILHVDFLEVFEDKPIKLSIPIRIVGNSPGVLKGGKLVKKFRKLNVKGLIKDMPEVIEVNISKLNINQSIRVMDINVPNLELTDKPTSQVVAVTVTRVVDTTSEEHAEAEHSEGEAPTETNS